MNAVWMPHIPNCGILALSRAMHEPPLGAAQPCAAPRRAADADLVDLRCCGSRAHADGRVLFLDQVATSSGYQRSQAT